MLVSDLYLHDEDKMMTRRHKRQFNQERRVSEVKIIVCCTGIVCDISVGRGL